MSTISPNMNLLISSIGTDSGLLWEQNLNTSLTTIDGHNHSAGSGVQIQPSGLLINTNLSFGNNSATNLQSTVYAAQSGFTTRQAVYVSGVDLYYNDGSGNAIQVTSGGLVNATSSGLSGSGGATASFSTGVLVVDGAANTPGNIKGGSVLIGNTSVGTNFCTVQVPAALAANYNFVLPTGYPAATSFLQMDTSGNLAATIHTSLGITASNIAANTITAGQIAANTITASQIANNTITATQIVDATITTTQIAANTILPSNMGAFAFESAGSNSGGFTTTSTSITKVSNQDIFFASNYNPIRPVFITFTGGEISLTTAAGPYTASFTIRSFNGLTYRTAASFTFTANTQTLSVPCGAINAIDAFSHGAAYSLWVQVNNAALTLVVLNVSINIYQV